MLKTYYVYLKKPPRWFKSTIVEITAEKIYETPEKIAFEIGSHVLGRFYKSEIVGWYQKYP